MSPSSTHDLCPGPQLSHLTKNCFLPLRLRSLIVCSILYVSESSDVTEVAAGTDWSMLGSWTGLSSG